MGEETSVELIQSNEILDLFGNLQIVDSNMAIDTVAELDFPEKGELRNDEMCFYQIKQLSFDEDYPRREAFENVLLSLDNPGFNLVYVIAGTEESVELYIGVVENRNESLNKNLSAVDYGKIVANVFEGNFNGSILERMKQAGLDRLVGSGIQNYKNAGVIIGIPSENEKDAGDEYDFQGIDRLITSMRGLEWRMVIVCEPVAKKEILELREDVYELYNRFSVYGKRTIQHSENDAKTINFGKNTSDTRGRNWGHNKGKTKSHQDGDVNEGRNEGNTEGEHRDHQEGTSHGFSMNRGSSNSVTVEIANKHAEEIMKYMDEELLERLKTGFSRGLFKSSIYYMAKEPTHGNRLKAGIMSLFQGDHSTYSPLYAQTINLEKKQNRDILRTYQSQYQITNNYSSDALLLLSRPFYQKEGLNEKYIGLHSYLTANEVSLLAGLPQKEVPGLTLKEGVSFGLNEKNIDKSSAVKLGVMVQKGHDLEKRPFYLSKDSMAKHIFIAGVTGSGKTTTCHKLLAEADIPFLVIEPAKTEYRTLINKDKEVVVFTLGNESVAPFRINPFELIEGEVISAHVDMIKATFTSAFPMEASMPQLLEEAIYKCYEKKGWNINTNTNEKYGKEAYKSEVNSFPILSDLLQEMRGVVESKNFSQQMQGDYIGSLVSRLSNLTVGSKGSMLNCEHSVDFDFLVENKVILEMEELRSPEDKALFMGFILSRLSAVIKEKHKKNHGFRHLTLIEEAHRLLSKIEYGDSGSKKAAVETFTDLLAEVRKYGEGLIVVDQIPNKLASEVLKNTNTKIIHKILARDDKEAVGDTMLMDDKQKEYLSALGVGNAIVFSEHTENPVHVHIDPVSDTNEEMIEDEIVRERFIGRLGKQYAYLEIDRIYPLFDKVACMISESKIDKEKFSKIREEIEKVANNYEISMLQIWQELIQRRDNRLGKTTANIEEDRLSILQEFYTHIFYKEDFCDDDILEYIDYFL